MTLTLNSAERAVDTLGMIRRGRWLGAILVPLVALVALVGEREGGGSPFCTDFRGVDKALEALREAKATDDFESVPDLVDDVADAYEGIEPPSTLRTDWTTAVQFFRHQAEAARSLLGQRGLAETPADEDARYGRAFTNITDYGIVHCGRVRGKLVP